MVKIVDLTPARLRCSLGACPAVYELEDVTPEDLKCDIGVSCPAVHQAGGEFVIIGKKPSAEILAELGHRVGEDEDIIVIGKGYFVNAFPG